MQSKVYSTVTSYFIHANNYEVFVFKGLCASVALVGKNEYDFNDCFRD